MMSGRRTNNVTVPSQIWSVVFDCTMVAYPVPAHNSFYKQEIVAQQRRSLRGYPPSLSPIVSKGLFLAGDVCYSEPPGPQSQERKECHSKFHWF